MAVLAVTRPVLHVEVKLQSNCNGLPVARPIAQIICNDIATWIAARYAYLKINDPICFLEDIQKVHNAVQSVEIANVSGDGFETEAFCVADVELDVQAYELHDDSQLTTPGAAVGVDAADEDAPQPRAIVTTLPGKSLDGLWNSLIFETSIHKRLLRFLTRMMGITNRPMVNLLMMNWNRLILLYGPPGTGKTTLCRALAQKLAIRLGQHFSRGKLIEINCESILSKWFSESVKMIGKLFDGVQRLADDPTLLVCVLIDEVENLTGSRDKAVKGNECGDSIRATNRLLTALDQLRSRPNVVVFCTSNLLAALDAAFLDRVDLKQHIPAPCTTARYEILRVALTDLTTCGVVVHPAPANPEDGTATAAASSRAPAATLLPDFKTYKLLHWADTNTPAHELWSLAERTNGRSARTLRRLPFIAIALHTHSDPCALDEALAAVRRVVDEEEQDFLGVEAASRGGGEKCGGKRPEQEGKCELGRERERGAEGAGDMDGDGDARVGACEVVMGVGGLTLRRGRSR